MSTPPPPFDPDVRSDADEIDRLLIVAGTIDIADLSLELRGADRTA